ncbi:hypothetical protein [Streptomyces kanamyceticus]|uniref:hypothetical protein n=1 Tax=Streptomyces kanamyceticus TaxID=1967 RepID=UPI000AADCC56|nr:hypothetical protein [Streptomyces kanamyceticus]
MVAKKPAPGKPDVKECRTCKGTGEVARPVRVGRKRRVVGEQNGLCLGCMGSGEASTD